MRDLLPSNKSSLDKIKLSCKYNCEVPLSEAYHHMINCSKIGMDYDCWNCNKKTFSSSIKICKEHVDKIKSNNNLHKKRQRNNNINYDNNLNHDLNMDEILLIQKRKGLCLNLICLEDDKKSLETQLHEIKMRHKIKETINEKIKKLEIELNKGETLLELEQKIEKKNLELKLLKEEKDKVYNQLNDYSLKNKIICKNTENNINKNEDYYLKAIELNPKDSNALLKLGAFLTNLGRNKEAEEYIRKAIKLNPKNGTAYNNLGNLLFDNGRNNDEQAQRLAYNCFLKSIEIDKTNSNSYNGLGVLTSYQGKYQDAEKFCRKAIEIDSTNSMAYNDLGNILSLQNKNIEAEENYLKSLDLDFKNSDAHYNLANLYNSRKNFIAAEKHYLEAIEIDPSDRDFHNELGTLLMSLGRKNEANEFFKNALELS